MANQSEAPLDIQAEEQRLQTLVKTIMQEADKQGATACEVGASLSAGLSVNVRKGEVETVEFSCDQGVGITVYQGLRKGSASTSDTSPEAVAATVKAASDIARYASEDPHAGLADKSLMATDLPDLDLYHPWGLDAEQAIELALECEQAGLSSDKRIENSDGASISSHQSARVYGNSNGFIGSGHATRHSASCVLIGRSGEEMQRDYWYDVARDPMRLSSMKEIGRKAGERTVKRLDSRKLDTGQLPVIFSSELAGGVISHFLAAISGGSLYRQSSFLLDHLGKQVFPDWVHIHEQPRLVGGLGSAAFDDDGLATRDKDFVKDGVLTSYILSTYSARKLGMESTANAGGVHNLFIEPGEQNLQQLLKTMDKGLLVTELMGHGINIVTGDYSRGAAGFWVENGEIQYPVSEVTIAGNLKDMFMNLQAVGNDVDRRGNVQSGSLLVDGMMIAGN
ncbi:metalloprotease PmbA [Endozoicomonadaceae bacterium StTr2]